MQSRFETVLDDPFFTFVISFYPPPATPSPRTSSPLMTSSQPTTPSSLLTTSSLPTTSSLSTMSSLSTTSTLFTTRTQSTTPTTPTPSSPLLTPFPPTTPSPSVFTQPVTNPEPAPGSPVISVVTDCTEARFRSLAASTFPSGCGPATSLTSPASISLVCKLLSSHTISLTSSRWPRMTMVSLPKMSDDELREALSEYEKSRLLLPARLVPGFRGKLSMEDFCRRYELPEDIPSLLAQMGVKDAHGLGSKRLSDLRDKGMAPRSVKMLQLAVIRFSSESVS